MFINRTFLKPSEIQGSQNIDESYGSDFIANSKLFYFELTWIKPGFHIIAAITVIIVIAEKTKN